MATLGEMENENKKETVRVEEDKKDRKPIKPISEIKPDIIFSGFRETVDKLGESVLLFDNNDNTYSLNGFAGGQFLEYLDEGLNARLLNKEFRLTLEKKFSKRYQRDYYVISEVYVIETKVEVD